MIWRAFTPGQSASHPAAELLDEFIDTYVSWREECASVRTAYEHWVGCPREDRSLACASYLAALDREEQAALTHSTRCERVRAAVRGAA